MMRWDIINYFIKKYNYKTYLEIGYYKGWSFDKVECETRVAVDPNPCKTIEQILLPKSEISSHIIGKSEYLVKLTSDEYFSSKNNTKFDIIFIDGLHEAEQVKRDIENSLKHLSEGGVIILHDCNPPLYEHTTTGIDGCWTGDVYKTAINMNANPLVHFYTVDTDWGVGVLRPNKEMHTNHEPHVQKYIDNWELFSQNREDLLNLISVEEFLNRENNG
jgi:hypothetical protein